jgi:hypothetical protein
MLKMGIYNTPASCFGNCRDTDTLRIAGFDTFQGQIFSKFSCTDYSLREI